jgi:hypothetical protein
MMAWLVRQLSRALDPVERETVLGDLAESDAGVLRTLRDLLGLVARRQMDPWKHAGPWLALVAFAIPLSMFLYAISSYAAELAVNGVFMTGEMDKGDQAGFVVAVSIGLAALACWVWTTGVALGLLSRGAAFINGALFCALLILGLIAGVRSFDWTVVPAPTFGPFFYRVVMAMVQASLVLPAAIFGIRRGLHWRLERRYLIWIFIFSSTAAMVLQGAVALDVLREQNEPQPSVDAVVVNGAVRAFLHGVGSGTLLTVQLLSSWPILYWIGAPLRRRWQEGRPA